MNSETVVGIDISKDSFDVLLLQPEEHAAGGRFDNSKQGFQSLLRWLEQREVVLVHACMEATNRYWQPLAAYLHSQGFIVSVVNPKQVRHYALSRMSRNKTDAADARIITEYCRDHTPAAWQPPAGEQQALQDMTRTLYRMKMDVRRNRNRLRTLQEPHAAAALEAVNAAYQAAIERLTKEVDDLFDRYPKLQQQRTLLCSIPGVGPVISAAFLAEVADVADFAQAKQLIAYAGLAPGQHHSGSSVRKRTRLVKWGNKYLRSVFFRPAQSAHRSNAQVAALRQRLQQRQLAKTQITAAIMRKMLTQCYGVLKTGKPYDPRHDQLQQQQWLLGGGATFS